jgi:hypothetical protein
MTEPSPKRKTPPTSTPSQGKKRGKRAANSPKEGEGDTALDAGEKALLMGHVRRAFADIGPHTPPKNPFIYWDPDITFSCASKLIARYPVLQREAEKYDGKNDLAKKHHQFVRTASNNERSTQIRVMKAVWLNNNSAFSFTKYSDDPQTPEVEMSEYIEEQCPDMTVTLLRELLKSPSMYKHPEVFDLFCCGLEGGSFKHTQTLPCTPISGLITPSHEAHFRAELWWTLPHLHWRHGIGRGHAKERIATWSEFLPLVLQDRRDNEEAANLLRQTKYLEGVGKNNAPPDPEPAEDVGQCDEMYW